MESMDEQVRRSRKRRSFFVYHSKQAARKRIQKMMLVFIGAIAMFSLSACSFSPFDAVAKDSTTTFKEVLELISDRVEYEEEDAGWVLTAPDDSVRFVWSEDYSKTPLYDIMFELNTRSFLDAGLVISKMPRGYVFYENKLMIGKKLGSDELKYSGEITPLDAYEQIVKHHRHVIGYHTALDHYNVDLGNGNFFEWAKDFSINTETKENQDQDIVFVLNPEPFIEAGVDPQKVEGWTYMTVTVDVDGKPTEVYKFLKPFDLQ
ncbi:hypothetical protein LQZ18_07845 [Lachnospiraceae bacterium ZAX-1]